MLVTMYFMITGTLILAVFLRLLGFSRLWKPWLTAQLIDKIPGPRGIPILGNALEMAIDHCEYLQRLHVQWIRHYGGIYRLWLGNRPIVIISLPELMEPLLKNTKMIDKAYEYSFLSPWLGNCMFLTTGSEWKSRRHLLTPAFHFQILSNFFGTFNEQSRVLVDDLKNVMREELSKEIDLVPYITETALDIICETSMGIKVRDRSDSEEYRQAVHSIMQAVMQRGVRPWLQPEWTFYLSNLGRQTRRCISVLHRFTNEIIKERRKALQRESQPMREEADSFLDDEPALSKRRVSFLDLLIQNEAHLSDQYIREEVDLIMFAGHDTTASAMTWFLYCMAENQHVQQTLFEEIQQVFGDSDRDCTTQDLTRMNYLECCIKETLRLYPSVPAVMRCLTDDIQIGDYLIPAGTSVALMLYGMHRSPQVFEDPDEFKPERFFRENRHQNPFSYLPFSAGVRNCIGQKYGMLELKVVLSTLIRHFHFSIKEESKKVVIASSEIVLKPKTTMPLTIAYR